MKIKILTFHREHNYGANLQAYALRHHLISKGHEVAFIDLPRITTRNFRLTLLKRWIARTPRATATKIRHETSRIFRNPRHGYEFREFQKDFLRTTAKHYTSLRTLRQHPPHADCYLVGSDQVWNPRLVDQELLPAFFLDFGPSRIRRVAYAVSSGGEDFSVCESEKVTSFLKRFHRIGVRESSMCQQLRGLGIDDCAWTPDPTFLIDWSVHFGATRASEKKGIGIFLINPKHYQKLLFRQEPDSRNFLQYEKPVDFSQKPQRPHEWIKEISEKELLVTDSYHAALFAIYSQTPFWFLRWGEATKRDERIAAVLTALGLKDRACETVSIDKVAGQNEDTIDWHLVSSRITEMREVGFQFLSSALAS